MPSLTSSKHEVQASDSELFEALWNWQTLISDFLLGPPEQRPASLPGCLQLSVLRLEAMSPSGTKHWLCTVGCRVADPLEVGFLVYTAIYHIGWHQCELCPAPEVLGGWAEGAVQAYVAQRVIKFLA